jgi:hypothetical protein
MGTKLVQQHLPVAADTQEAEVGGASEPRSSRPSRKTVRSHFKKKKKKFKWNCPPHLGGVLGEFSDLAKWLGAWAEPDGGTAAVGS